MRMAVPRQHPWHRFEVVIQGGFSRYIIAWKLCTNMRAEDVANTLDMALAASGCDSDTVLHKPRLLSDNGPSYIAGELAEYIETRKMSHVRGAPSRYGSGRHARYCGARSRRRPKFAARGTTVKFRSIRSRLAMSSGAAQAISFRPLH